MAYNGLAALCQAAKRGFVCRAACTKPLLAAGTVNLARCLIEALKKSF